MIATLALGIGTTTAVFSVVDRILFRALPYAGADRLVSVGLVHSMEREEFTMGGFFFDWYDHQRSFAAMASQGTMLHACDLVEANPQQLNCIPVQAGFLPLLGISPVLGRNFSPDEDRPNGPSVALISYGVWLDHYNRDPHILNRLIDLDGNPTRVIGGLPKGFELPTVETPDVLVPMELNRAVHSVLPPDTVMPWVRSQIASLDPTVPVEMKTLDRTIGSLADRPRFETALLGFFAFTGLVMAVIGLYGVIAFMATQRTQEIGIRMALGASRLDILRLILREGVRLLALGGAVGLGSAFALSRVLKSLLFGIGPHDPASFIAVTLLLALVALVATLIPARSAMKIDPMTALRCE